ncbi:MAG: glycoside hydrolase family 15 protein [Steroidobacteraceae bacterium]|nr:glycoside hydrolase family 15 protein [Steroidobacteraceae bacterium]
MSQATRGDGLDLALIGNCQIAVLVDRLGSIVWGCLPRPDADPVFCALLKPEGGQAPSGVFAVDLRGVAEARSAYVRNTAILETVLTDAEGNSARITDFCPRFRRRGRVFRPMSIVRLVEPLAGRPVVTIRMRPTRDYGTEEPQRVAGSHHIRYIAPPLQYRLTTNASLSSLFDESPFVLDGAIALILTPDETIEHAPLSLARDWLSETHAYWQDWVLRLAIPFDWQEAVIRAAITLKLCTFEDTGAVLAAITTSIPEIAGSPRNWDYRYCWLRDSFFVIHALNRLGATNTMEGYLRYLDRVVVRSSNGALQPLYGIGGETCIEERIVTSLEGYLGMGPVRIGNLAYEQTQHDVYGAIVLAACQLFFDQRLSSLGDKSLFARLEVLGERAAARFAQPDAGPWEFRGSESVHTFSAVMCWAACDRLARIADQLGLDERAGFWRPRSDAMREQILLRAWNASKNAFVGCFEGAELDATVLLLPELGFLEASDPRFVSTLGAVERELVRGDLVYRYRHADDFGVPANTFTMCSFWYVNALAGVGRTREAREMFESLLARRNAAGLFSEDIDPESGRQWGNFPQTYSMVGVITSALRLSRTWEEML